MAKQQTYQKYVYKIHSSKILRNKKKLNITLDELRKSEELISLADSQVLRFVDDINGINKTDIEETILKIRNEINQLKKQDKSFEQRNRIKSLYSELDSIQHKSDYMAVVMDNKKDIYKLKDGFNINGQKYYRLVGTPNGVKKSTVVYVSEKAKSGAIIYNELEKRLNNGRDEKKLLVPAKFEAYKSLACSASIPVSDPKGILVVDDLVLHFKADIIELNDENSDEPIMTEKNDMVELIDSDGYGLILPSLAEQWSKDLLLNETLSGCCIRNAFLKGMVFPFEFDTFVDKFKCNHIIKDVWGNEHNIDDIDMILTTSMLKLWDSYKSIDDYIENCKKNKYTFSVTKVCPEVLENERTLNYQFIQSYKLSDKEIKELIFPTVNEIKDVINGDVNKSLLFLRGLSINENNADKCDNDFIKALSIDDRLISDPYVINKIQHMINKRINEAKIGTVKVTGNYAIISGDAYALCQHIFKTNVDSEGNNIDDNMGLLKAGEIYSKYWSDRKVNKVACFRAPMSCASNIRVMNIHYSDEANFWFKHMKTVNIVNCHDTLAHALNGFDKDSDILMTTNNKILIDNTITTPAIMCVQRKAAKKVITDDLLCEANCNSFGDEIGTTTNHITAMFDIMSYYSEGSDEYETLDYRIKCGQLYQQNAIDSVKGIVCKSMPKYWYTRVKNDKQNKHIDFNNSIVADKKPYFMNYVYPQQRTKYNKYIKNSNNKCICLFGISLNELINKQDKTEEQKDFIKWFNILNPVSDGNCVMNRLCRMVEKEFDGFITDLKSNSTFDYSILKSNVEYSKKDYIKIYKLYEEYKKEVKNHMIKSNKERLTSEENSIFYNLLINSYKEKCFSLCSNEKELCDIVLDICYTSDKSKQFAWDICSDIIINNLLDLNKNKIKYIVEDNSGDINYCGKTFSKREKEVKGCE